MYAYIYYGDEKCQTIKNAKEVPKCASYIQCEISKLKPIYLIFSSFPHLLKVISQVHYKPSILARQIKEDVPHTRKNLNTLIENTA